MVLKYLQTRTCFDRRGPLVSSARPFGMRQRSCGFGMRPCAITASSNWHMDGCFLLATAMVPAPLLSLSCSSGLS